MIKINFDLAWLQNKAILGFVVTNNFGRILNYWIDYSTILSSEEAEAITLQNVIQHDLLREKNYNIY